MTISANRCYDVELRLEPTLICGCENKLSSLNIFNILHLNFLCEFMIPKMFLELQVLEMSWWKPDRKFKPYKMRLVLFKVKYFNECFWNQK